MDGFLRSQLVKYRHVEICTHDVSRALQQYKGLRPNLQKFIHNDGRETELLAMEGTVPVQYRGVTYHIPVCVWLQENHPYVPPLVFVKPTNTMAIRASKHVDSNGRVYHPYLHEWNYPKSDLAALLQLLCCVFAEQPPVYARPAAGPATNYNRPPLQPQPGYPQAQYGAFTANPSGTTPYPVRGPTRMPMPVPMPIPGSSPGGPGVPPYPAYHPQRGGAPPKPPYPPSTQPSYPPNTQSSYPPVPPTYPPVTQANLVTTAPSNAAATPQSDLLPSTVRASLMTAVEDKLKRRTRALFEQAQSELDELNKTQLELKKGSEKLEDILKRLEMEQEGVDNDIKMLTQKNEEIVDVVTKLEGDADKLDIDEAVVTTTPLYNQILNLFAEENAVEDTIYYLSESLRKEAIDLEIFLKHVRALSRKQFMLRALLYKARKTAGLSEVAGS